jgi:hypothetical protein
MARSAFDSMVETRSLHVATSSVLHQQQHHHQHQHSNVLLLRYDTHEMTPPATRMNLVMVGWGVAVFVCGLRDRQVGQKCGFFLRVQAGRAGLVTLLGVYERDDSDE